MTTSHAPAHSFASFDGQTIVWRELGAGRPVVLLHGLFSSAETNWLRYGTAATVAAAGFRVIMPDLRAHGDSAAPHDAAGYPKDVLAQDIAALVGHLGLVDYDLGGYSLGARTTVRCLVRGLAPRRVVLAGMGLAGIVAAGDRAGFFLDVIADPGRFERGTPGWMAAQFMKNNAIDGEAVAHILRLQAVTPLAELAAIDRPTLVVCGVDDQDNGAAADLAAALPDASYVEIAGNHMSAVTKPALGTAIADFLSA